MDRIDKQLPQAQSQALQHNSPDSESSRVTILSVLVTALRGAKGLPAEDPEDVEFTAKTWSRILAAIPTQSLNDAFIRAMMHWSDPSKPFGTPQILSAWNELEEENRAEMLRQREEAERERKAAAYRNPETYRCWVCNDLGYQRIRIFCPKLKEWTERSRACSCDATPEAQRVWPFGGLDWEKSDRGVWYLPNNHTIECTCLRCKGYDWKKPDHRWQPGRFQVHENGTVERVDAPV